MFSKQAAAILTNLLQAGFSAPQAAALQSLFGQTQQPIVHGGPVQLDYTRQDMRLIGPDDAIRRSGASEPLRFERAVEDLAKLRGKGVGVDAPLDLDRRLAEG